MSKNGKEFIFQNIEGIWRNVQNKEFETLADFLHKYEIIIDDRTQFARLYDYERNIVIYYRAFNMAKVVITIYPLEYE